MNEELTKALEALENKLKDAHGSETKALKDEIAELKSQVENGDTVAVKEFNELKSQFEEQALLVKELQSKGTDEKKKGELLVAIEKSIAENNPADNKSHQFKHVIKAAAVMTTANILPNVTGGFNQLFGNYIDTEIGTLPTPDLLMMPLITVEYQIGTEVIWWVERVNEEGDAEFVDEGDLNPLADGEYQEYSTQTKEISLEWKFAKRLMNRTSAVVTDFAEHSNELVEQKVDDTLLDGDSSVDTKSFDGINTKAGAFVVPTALANYYANANIFDAIMAVATMVRKANFKGELTAILGTEWKAKMQGIKDTQGRYIVPSFVSPDGTKVGEVAVVFSNKQDADVITLGDLKKYRFVVAKDITYDEGYNGNDFSQRQITKMLDTSGGAYMKGSDAGSIISDDIATILTAIETVEA